MDTVVWGQINYGETSLTYMYEYVNDNMPAIKTFVTFTKRQTYQNWPQVHTVHSPEVMLTVGHGIAKAKACTKSNRPWTPWCVCVHVCVCVWGGGGCITIMWCT